MNCKTSRHGDSTITKNIQSVDEWTRVTEARERIPPSGASPTLTELKTVFQGQHFTNRKVGKETKGPLEW